MRPPPRWIRRTVLAPLVVCLALALVASVPVWVLVTLALSPVVPGRLRPLRVIWLAAVYLLVEAVALLAMFGLWVVSGFGARIRAPAFRRAHYRLCSTGLRVLYRQAAWVLRLTVHSEGTNPDAAPAGRPLVVLCRHAGPGDSFLLAHALINWYSRQPRIVLKESLQWDPLIDVLLNRLPNVFIGPSRDQGDDIEATIADLASGISESDALVLFPEGGNFTPHRRLRAIERLHRLGLHRMARRARAMRNVLPPQPGGVLAALAAAPHADLVLVGHTGVDHMLTIADVWRELPMDKTIVMHWWLQPGSEVPAGADERIEWLYRWWARIDQWIATSRPAAVVPSGLAEGGAVTGV
jgi:1-acyl-sn-glycerol-3-phosphate acyltransferase